MLNKKHWWKFLLALFLFGGMAVLLLGIETYRGAPPIPTFVTEGGSVVLTANEITEGQIVFQRRALMEHGSMFGDGGGRGPDYTAETLHEIARSMNAYYSTREPTIAAAMQQFRVREELKRNTYNATTHQVVLSEAHALSFDAVVRSQTQSLASFGMHLTEPEVRALSAFFFWGAWVCSAQRPGSSVSYTQNWPYDEYAGNTLTTGSIFWSVVGTLALFLSLGASLYLYGRSAPSTWQPSAELEPLATNTRVDAFVPTKTQRSTYKFFLVAALLFLLQVLSGVLTVHDFVGFTHFFGVDLSQFLPLTVTRSWHLQLALLWIATCWIAGSIFLLPSIAGEEPPKQQGYVHLLFWLLVLTVAGMLVGVFLGPRGALGTHWQWLGHQGWEFVELGRLWQCTLFAALLLWAFVIFRGLRPVLQTLQPFALPNWIFYAVATIALLFVSSFVAQPTTNFVIADFWRWMVVHMWAECFFEVFTTVIVGWYLVKMGLLTRERATRMIYFATLLFCGSGFVGIAHNFYWNAKPELTLALGSVFSTMQVLPLLLVTLDAWRFRQTPSIAERQTNLTDGDRSFGLHDAYMFLVAVNFWNFFGAGVLGFLINLPMVNYFEHGTYLTVNHGHAALMGVYGNLSIAALLFCCRHLLRPECWNPTLFRVVFWSMNIGLLLMVLLDLFPVGLLQFHAVLSRGLWYARSNAFLQSEAFQTLTWMRLLGGALFVVGGVFPLVFFLLSNAASVRACATESAKSSSS